MANLNKVMLIGRLTRDPETRMTNGGAKLAKFSIAVNNRKKNSQTGQYEDDPCFLDCTAWNQEYKKLADLVEQYLSKGNQVYVEGRLTLEKWTSQDGQNRQAIKVIVENIQFLEKRDQQNTTTAGQGNSYQSDSQRSYSAPPFEEQDGIPF